MSDRLLDAIACAVRMKRGAYTWSEALSYASLTYDLDEYQREDLPRLARRQYQRLQEQTA